MQYMMKLTKSSKHSYDFALWALEAPSGVQTIRGRVTESSPTRQTQA